MGDAKNKGKLVCYFSQNSGGLGYWVMATDDNNWACLIYEPWYKLYIDGFTFTKGGCNFYNVGYNNYKGRFNFSDVGYNFSEGRCNFYNVGFNFSKDRFNFYNVGSHFTIGKNIKPDAGYKILAVNKLKSANGFILWACGAIYGLNIGFYIDRSIDHAHDGFVQHLVTSYASII